MSQIDRIRYQLQDFAEQAPKTKQKALKTRANKLIDEISRHNRHNIEALLSPRSVDLHSVQYDSDSMVWTEDYEVSCSYGEYETLEEIEEEIEKVDTEIENAQGDVTSEENTIEELEGEIEAYEQEKTDGVYNEKKIAKLRAKLATAKVDLNKVHERIRDLEERKEGLERDRDEPEYDEVYWNTMWRPFNEDINEKIAKRFGLGILTFLKGAHEGESFMFLQGCGMDLTPKIMAYIALEHKTIDPEHVHFLARRQDRGYAEHVIGRDGLLEVADALEIREAMVLALKQDAIEEKKRRAVEEKRRRAAEKKASRVPSQAFRKLVAEVQAENDKRIEALRAEREQAIAAGSDNIPKLDDDSIQLYEVRAEARARLNDASSGSKRQLKAAVSLLNEVEGYYEYNGRIELSDILARGQSNPKKPE